MGSFVGITKQFTASEIDDLLQTPNNGAEQASHENTAGATNLLQVTDSGTTDQLQLSTSTARYGLSTNVHHPKPDVGSGHLLPEEIRGGMRENLETHEKSHIRPIPISKPQTEEKRGS